MVERDAEARLTEVLKASADPTRRAILTMLAQEGPLRVTDLASHFDMSLNAVSKHIKVLESAGLVTRRKEWREHLIEARMEETRQIDRWFKQLRSVWELRLEALNRHLTKGDGDE